MISTKAALQPRLDEKILYGPMKTSGWKKVPLWARYLGILLGFPLIVGVLRAALEHWFPRFIGDLLLVIVLIVVCIPILWKRKEHTRQMRDAPMTKEEKQHEKREEHKLFCLLMAFYTLVLLTGTFMGFCIMFSATPPGYTALLYGVFRLFGAGIGIVCLVVTHVCFEQTKFEVLLLKGDKPSRTVSGSVTAALCVLVIVLAIAFAITRLARL